MSKVRPILDRLGRGDLLPDSDLPWPEWVAGLQLAHFSLDEIQRPNHPDVARRLGFAMFAIPTVYRKRAAVVLHVADLIRVATRRPIRMRNAYRPPPYNAAVGGARGSDHVTAQGVDLDFQDAEHREQAECFLRGLDAMVPDLELSIGCGRETLHVGAMTVRGRREWYYPGYDGRGVLRARQ